MRKIRIFEHVSLDGVIQNSNDGDGFPFADWTTAYRTPDGAAALAASYGDQFDLLLGRRTYDMWSGYWPKAPDGPMSNPLNAATKYVVSHRADGLEWGPVEHVGADVVAGIRQIKSRDGRDLITWGSSTVTHMLFEHGLADELTLLVYPVIVGTGKKFYPQQTPARALELMSTRATQTGIVVNHYKVNGPLKTG